MDLHRYEKYLPSKKFAKIIGIIGGGLLAILIITSFLGSRGNFNWGSGKNGSDQKAYAKGTIGALVTADSNSNGIPDWEESLWGLDPTADGATNKKIIDQKKADNAANLTEEEGNSAPGTTATDEFAKQLLSTILALQQSGALTPNAVANLAMTVDSTVDAKHADIPTYTILDIKVADGKQAKAEYKTAFKAVLDNYADVDLGSELTLIANGLGDGGEASLQKLDPIANAYTEISKKIIALPTPKEAVPFALNLANATAQMGASLKQIESIHADVISGMVGVNDYIKASDSSDQASQNFRAYFSS